MKELNEDLKTGNFKQAYLLYGEESYLKRQFKNRFIKAIVPEEDTMNFTYFEGKGIDADAVIEHADTLPFFSDCRLIILEESGFFKTGDNPLISYLSNISETTRIIFIENEVDKRSKMYKAIKEYGMVTELSYQGEDILRKWIASQAKNQGKEIERSTIDYLLQRVGVEMESIQNELEKLFAFTYKRELITREDIEQVSSGQIYNQIFEMVNAVASGNQNKALKLYYDLLTLKEPPMRILFLLVRQYRLTYQVKDIVNKGFTQKEIATKMGLHPFVAGKYIEQGRGFTNESLRATIEEGINLENEVKTGQLQDKLAGELFIIKSVILKKYR
jgi:DNA polymerase-3 subunit delta